MNVTTLDRLTPGERGVVRRFLTGGAMTRRLMELGLVPGTPVCCAHRRPRGGPSAFRFRGALVALRPGDSRAVLVERC